MTYPSGRVVEYTRDVNGRVEQVDTDYNLQNYLLADSITYMPFGPMNAITYGNNLEHTRGYDEDYRVTELLVGDATTLQALAYTYDDANNITEITNVLDGSRTQTFDYDDLNRLTDASGNYGTHVITYDANGNRLTRSRTGAMTETYSYVSNTHHLDEIDRWTIQAFSYDNNGNTTSNGTHDLIYGDNNRLASVEVSSTPVAEYVYNGKGERVIKELTDPILYYYDQNGQLLAELDENGDTIREYAWIDGQPLAMMIEDVIFGYHNDHLGTPQFMTDDFQGIVWEANYEPFGKANITTSTVTNNLRFPGQYFDDETDLHYNYFRDYDPNTGRYVQSDPIGVGGGINTYLYVNANPTQFIDRLGLETPTISLMGGVPNLEEDCLMKCIVKHYTYKDIATRGAVAAAAAPIPKRPLGIPVVGPASEYTNPLSLYGPDKKLGKMIIGTNRLAGLMWRLNLALGAGLLSYDITSILKCMEAECNGNICQ